MDYPDMVSASLHRPHRRLVEVLFFFTLILISIPTVVGFKIAQIMPRGFALELNAYQILVGIAFLAATLLIGIGRPRPFKILKLMFGILILSAIYDLLLAMFVFPGQKVAYIRGIGNFALNTSVCAVIQALLIYYIPPQRMARYVMLFGLVVASSGIFEFLALKLSPALLEGWRNLLFLGLSDVNAGRLDVMKIGGVNLSDTGISRVGGLIGAPENLGMVLALTLGFLPLANLSARMQLFVFSSYIAVAIFSGSRYLGIGLALYSIISVLQLRAQNTNRRFITIASWIVAIGLVSWLGWNIESFQRFQGEAWEYEWQWRLASANNVVSSLATEPWAAWLGLGLGWGVEEYFGWNWKLSSGLLGGDWITAYGLAGVLGLAIILSIWLRVIRTWRDLGRTGGNRMGLSYYIFLAAAASLALNHFSNWFLFSSILTILPITLITLHEAALRLGPPQQ